MKNQEFRNWATEQCLPVFYAAAFLTCIFLNLFHWIMPLITGGLYDSLPTRLWGTVPCVILTLAVLLRPSLKKYTLEFHIIVVSAPSVSSIWVTAILDYHPYYLAASLLAISTNALSLITMAQVWGVFILCNLSLIPIYIFADQTKNLFPYLYYATFFAISLILSWVKVRAHKQEFELIQSLQKTFVDIEVEKSKNFAYEQLSFAGELAGNLAHEVSNPLTSSQTSLHRLQEKVSLRSSPDDDVLLLFKKCFSQLNRMKNLVENILHFSVSHFKESTPQNAKEILDSAIALVRDSAEKNQVHLDLSYEAGSVLLGCSNREALQVFFQTLKNAVEAAANGPADARRWVRVESHLSSQNTYDLTISDSGKGLSSEIRSKLFLPFVVGKEKKGHLGLGLSTARSILERCSGQIIHLEDREHTTFQISIPVV